MTSDKSSNENTVPQCSQPGARIQYENWKRHPKVCRAPTPDEWAAEVDRLAHDLKVQEGVVELAYIPHRNLVEQRDEIERQFKNFHRLLCERFEYGHDKQEWKRDQLSLIEHIASRLSADESAPETPAPQAPIARMMVANGHVSWTFLNAPGLPDGKHDVFCEPEAVAPYLGMRHTLQEIRDHSTDTWAKGLARESVGPKLCPHGMPLDENVCGPCSKGAPNKPAQETSAHPDPAKRCQHDLLKPACTIIVGSPFSAQCAVCLENYRLPESENGKGDV